MRCGIVLLVAVTCCHAVTDQQFNTATRDLNNKIRDLTETVGSFKAINEKTVQILARQLSLQQLYVEEQTRADGNSGVKIVRLSKSGTKSYYEDTFTAGHRVLSSHNHADFQDTVGMGELVAVLNGVQFRTRHNDYRLLMPHRTNKAFGMTEKIPKPNVPPAVLSKTTIEEQAAEMREWFKAWQNQDHRRRDYRQYFKPVLCYLEGMWTQTDMNNIDEPFASDRHQLDASSFFALQDTIKFSVNTGRKSTKENLAFLPTTVNGFDEDGVPQLAQWNYKILCHPLKRNVPLSQLRLMDDLPNKLARGKTKVDWNDRSARFELYHTIDDADDRYQFSLRDGYDRDNEGTFLDKLMAEIPGKDNYKANIVDDVWDEKAFPYDSKATFRTSNTSRPLNAGYYHRAYKTGGADAMGASIRRRGFHDNNLYTALTRNEKVTGHSTSKCARDYSCNRQKQRRGDTCKLHKCRYWTQRASFAIPLEIIYMTPLMSWNPYNIKIHPDNKPDIDYPTTLNIENNKKRNGQLTRELAYNGCSRKKYYITPVEFFAGEAKRVDAADTAVGSVGVLDRQGEVRRTVASGVSILTNEIAGLGKVRLRYPIPFTFVSGDTTQKDLDALKELTLYPSKYQRFFPGAIGDNGTIEEVFTFSLARAVQDPPGPHFHTLELTATQLREMKYKKKLISVTTDTSNGHSHNLKLQYKNRGRKWWINVRECDGTRVTSASKSICFDQHGKFALECLDCVNRAYPV